MKSINSVIKLFILLITLLLTIIHPTIHTARVSETSNLDFTLISDDTTSADTNQEISVGLSNTLTIRTNGNATTGYSWFMTQNGDEIKPTNINKYSSTDDYLTNASNNGGIGLGVRASVGGGGQWNFKFNFTKVGNSYIKFVYKRPWETETLIKVNLIVKISKSPPDQNQKIVIVNEKEGEIEPSVGGTVYNDKDNMVGNMIGMMKVNENVIETSSTNIIIYGTRNTNKSLSIMTLGMFLLLALVIFTI